MAYLLHLIDLYEAATSDHDSAVDYGHFDFAGCIRAHFEILRNQIELEIEQSL